MSTRKIFSPLKFNLFLILRHCLSWSVLYLSIYLSIYLCARSLSIYISIWICSISTDDIVFNIYLSIYLSVLCNLFVATSLTHPFYLSFSLILSRYIFISIFVYVSIYFSLMVCSSLYLLIILPFFFFFSPLRTNMYQSVDLCTVYWIFLFQSYLSIYLSICALLIYIYIYIRVCGCVCSIPTNHIVFNIYLSINLSIA